MNPPSRHQSAIAAPPPRNLPPTRSVSKQLQCGFPPTFPNASRREANSAEDCHHGGGHAGYCLCTHANALVDVADDPHLMPCRPCATPGGACPGRHNRMYICECLPLQKLKADRRAHTVLEIVRAVCSPLHLYILKIRDDPRRIVHSRRRADDKPRAVAHLE